MLELQKRWTPKKPLPIYSVLSLPKAGACESNLPHISNLQTTEGDKQQKKKEKKKRQKKEKQKKREEELEIPRNRAKESTFINKLGEWRLQWKNTEIGTYIEPGEPRPIEEVLKKTFKWTHIDVQIKHPTQIKNLHLEEGFLNFCACQQTNTLRKNEFITHLYDKHKGVVPPNSQVNMPYWIYGVLFDTDDMEILYCRTLYD